MFKFRHGAGGFTKFETLRGNFGGNEGGELRKRSAFDRYGWNSRVTHYLRALIYIVFFKNLMYDQIEEML